MAFSLDDAQRVQRALSQLDAIHEATSSLGVQMATVTEALSQLADAMTGLESDVARVLAALATETLSPAAHELVDALQERYDALNTALDTGRPSDDAVTPPLVAHGSVVLWRGGSAAARRGAGRAAAPNGDSPGGAASS